MTYESKAAQKRALEALSREYTKLRNIITNELLLLKTEANPEVDELYWLLPYDLHNWRAKHEDARFEEQNKDIRIMVAQRKMIKATPIVKPAPRTPKGIEGTQDRAICSCCGSEQAIDENGLIAYHGYQRFYGMHGACYGSRLPHFGIEAGKAVGYKLISIWEYDAKYHTINDRNGNVDSRRTQSAREMFKQSAAYMTKKIINWTPQSPITIKVWR